MGRIRTLMRRDIMRDDRIDALKYHGIIGMVLLHSNYLLDDVSGDIPIQIAVSNIAGIGLPLYFFLSAYFFAIGYSDADMERKIISRIKKIAIPYVFWQFFMIKVYGVLGRLEQSSIEMRFIDETYFPSGIKETLRFVYRGWRDPPLWYLLVLMQFVFITPVLIMLIKKFQYISLLAIGMIVLINLGYYGGIPYTSLLYWMPEYLSGIWAAIYVPSMVGANKCKKMDMRGGTATAGILFWWIGSCVLFKTEKDTLYNYLKYVGWVLAPIALLEISHFLPQREFLYKGQFDAEYIIFCIHYPLTHMLATMAGNFVKPIGDGQMIAFWIGVASAVLLCCHMMHYFLAHWCKPVYRLLYGDY